MLQKLTPLQWMSWSPSSVTVSFTNSTNLTVVLDGTRSAVPKGDEWLFVMRGSSPEASLPVPLAAVCAGW